MNALNVGDILYSQWGYSMVLVDFYKVIKVTPKMVTLVKIESKDDVVTGFLCGTVMPDPTNLEKGRMGAPIVFTRKRRGPDGWGVCGDYHGHSSAHRWDGEPVSYNHCD